MALAAEPEANGPAPGAEAPEASSAGCGATELGPPVEAGASSGTAPALSNGTASPADAVASSGASTEPDQAVSPGDTGGVAAGRAPGGVGLAAVVAGAGGESEPDTTPCIVSSADGGATAAHGEGGGGAAGGAAHAAPEGAAAAPGGAAAAEAAAGAAPAAREGGTLAERLAQQVEFYFSDANLPTDAFMLKQLARSPEGWVPLKVIAKFNRIKALAGASGGAIAALAAALACSGALEVSAEGARVRRRAPLPELAPREALERTVIADNLPDPLSIEDAMALFGRAGSVAMVRICPPGSGPKSTAQLVWGADLAVSNQRHALVEFQTPGDAARAVAELTDANNWRSGLRVRHLLRSAAAGAARRGAPKAPPSNQGRPSPARVQPHGQRPEAAAAACESAAAPLVADGDGAAARGAGDAADGIGGAPGDQGAAAGEGPSGAAGAAAPPSRKAYVRRSKADYAAWAAATPASRAAASQPHRRGGEAGGGGGAPAAGGGAEGAACGSAAAQAAPGDAQAAGTPGGAPNSAPRMPDGSRGFTAGRGRRLAQAVAKAPGHALPDASQLGGEQAVG